MEKTVERIVNAERMEDLIAVFGSFDELKEEIAKNIDFAKKYFDKMKI